MNAKSPAQIKAILGRKSENAAVQKTLSRIYSKFRITGAGPGKLSKLHKIISDRLQAKYGKQKLLIAWAGRDSKYKGEKIKDIIFNHPQIEAFVLDLDVDPISNQTWLQEIEHPIADANFAILCLPGESFEQTWVHFVIGFF